MKKKFEEEDFYDYILVEASVFCVCCTSTFYEEDEVTLAKFMEKKGFFVTGNGIVCPTCVKDLRLNK
jgi:hypothetical protein